MGEDDPVLSERVAAPEKAVAKQATERDMVRIQGRLVRIERKLERLLAMFRLTRTLLS